MLLGIISTPTSRPVIAAARLRKGSTNSAKGRVEPCGDREQALARSTAAITSEEKNAESARSTNVRVLRGHVIQCRGHHGTFPADSVGASGRKHR